MSGPDQAHDADTDGIANASNEHKHQQNHSRIPISNLLCSADVDATKSTTWNSPKKETAQLQSLPQPEYSYMLGRTLRPTGEGERVFEQRGRQGQQRDLNLYSADIDPSISSASPISYYAVHRRSSTSGSRTTSYDRPMHPHPPQQSNKDHFPSDLNERRDSGLGRREPDVRALAHSPNALSSYSSRDPVLQHSPVERRSPHMTLPQSSLAAGYFVSRAYSAGQRSVSLSADYYQANCHPYDAEDNHEQRRRMDRSKSDFALHQQNYGPYLDQSPTLEPLPMFTPKRYSASYSTPEDHVPITRSPPPSMHLLSVPSPHQHDHSSSPGSHSRSPYSQPHAPRRSFQGESRRGSLGIILPPPESLFSSHERKPARIYGLDAADVPTRPPLAPSSSFGAQPLQDIPDGREVEYTRRPSSADAYERFPPSRDSSAANPPYVHDRRPSTTTTYEENQPHHQPAARSRYDYSSQETQKSSINANPSIPYAHPHSESRAYSPVMDIQPPSWYKQYANAVSLNNPPPPRASFSQGESAAYASVPRRGSDFGPSRNMHPQHRRSPEPWLARSSFSAAASPVADGVARPMSGAAAHGGNSYNHGLSKPKSRLASGHSVHPFDLPAESQGCSTSPKAGKRDRGQEEDQFSQENGGVKAKRKRANAEQLSVLNAAFERSYFPSTEERLRLSKQTKMCPRTVQIWFQNKRQSVKARTEAMDAAVAALPGRRRGSHSVLERPVGDGADERNFRNMADDDGAGTDYHYEHVRTPQQTLKQQPHQAQHPPPLQHISTFQGEKRRNSGPLTPSDALMSSLQIQYDGRSVDFFSRKRRATVARMELSDPR